MANQEFQDNMLSDEIYSPKNVSAFKVVTLGLALMLVGFLMNYPLSLILEQKIEAALFSDPSCPIKSNSKELRLFPFSLRMRGVSVPSSCFGQLGGNLHYDSVHFHLARPSFYPIGLLLRLEVLAREEKINLDLGVGIPSPKFRLHKSNLDSSTLNILLGTPNLLRGKFELEGQGSTSWSSLDRLNLIIGSTNLAVSSQNIQGLQLPAINLGQAMIKLRVQEGHSVTVEEMIIGNSTSPLRANIQGGIELNQHSLGLSQLNLLTELSLDQQLINSFPIVNLFLGSYQTTPGTFRFGLNGNLAGPSFSRP
jgi:hypothetical protein